jgi:hypothetical protein
MNGHLRHVYLDEPPMQAQKTRPLILHLQAGAAHEVCATRFFCGQQTMMS